MKTIYLLLAIALIGCTKYETIEIEIEPDVPNITLSGVQDQLKPNLNTYAYWKVYAKQYGHEILDVHAMLCDQFTGLRYSYFDSLRYQFNLANNNMEWNWYHIQYFLNSSVVMCDNENESDLIDDYLDSLKLENYIYMEFEDMVEFSIDFIEKHSKDN